MILKFVSREVLKRRTDGKPILVKDIENGEIHMFECDYFRKIRANISDESTNIIHSISDKCNSEVVIYIKDDIKSTIAHSHVRWNFEEFALYVLNKDGKTIDSL